MRAGGGEGVLGAADDKDMGAKPISDRMRKIEQLTEKKTTANRTNTQGGHRVQREKVDLYIRQLDLALLDEDEEEARAIRQKKEWVFATREELVFDDEQRARRDVVRNIKNRRRDTVIDGEPAFATDDEYNDYLEGVEDTLYKLVHGNAEEDKEEQAQLEAFKLEHRDEIARNKAREDDEEKMRGSILHGESEVTDMKRKAQLLLDEEKEAWEKLHAKQLNEVSLGLLKKRDLTPFEPTVAPIESLAPMNMNFATMPLADQQPKPKFPCKACEGSGLAVPADPSGAKCKECNGSTVEVKKPAKVNFGRVGCVNTEVFKTRDLEELRASLILPEQPDVVMGVAE
jgi:hypothetical protein